jgi:flagellar hook-length control protein FliK
MDITALLAAAPANSAQPANPSSDHDGASFAQTLDQAQAAAAASSPTPTPAAPAQAQAPTAAPAPAIVAPQATMVPVPGTLTDASQTAPAPELLAAPPLPSVAMPAQPTLAPSDDRWEQALQQAFEAEAPPVALAAPSETPLALDELGMPAEDDAASDPLQRIRERMQLIENAGALDPTPSAAAVAAVAPAIVAVAPAQPNTTTDADVQLDSSRPGNGEDLLRAGPSSRQTAAQLSDAQDLSSAASQASANAAEGRVAALSQGDAPDQPFSASLPAMNPTSTALSSSIGVTASSATPTLNAELGTRQWQEGLNQQLVGLFRRGEQQMDLQLHPADLGPLLIKLTVNDSGTHAQFLSAQASVRSVVEQALPQLRDALAEQGITLGQASVSDQSSRQAQGDQASRGGSRGAGGEVAEVSETLLESTALSLSSLTAGIDLYA